MLYLMEDSSSIDVTGSAIFIVPGGALPIYSVLTRETSKRYAMKPLRCTLWNINRGLALRLLLQPSHPFAVEEAFVPVATLMVFFLPGFGVLLFLLLTGTSRRKPAGN